MSAPKYRAVRLLGLVVILTVGGYWAVRPFRYPPQGLHPAGWSYAQLVRDRYPVHLIAPEWLHDDFLWCICETLARTTALAGATASALILARKRPKIPA